MERLGLPTPAITESSDAGPPPLDEIRIEGRVRTRSPTKRASPLGWQSVASLIAEGILS